MNNRGASTTTNYAGNYIYEIPNIGPEELKFFNQPEGSVEPDGSGGFDYVYQYKDHLGNIRISYKDISTISTPNLEIQEENNYYPFGLKHKGYNGNIVSEHPYKYNGKELNEVFDINTYDLGARHMDPALGRFMFMTIDPMADFVNFQSPYVMANNNPVQNVDEYGFGILNAIGNIFRRVGRGIKRLVKGPECSLNSLETLRSAWERPDFGWKTSKSKGNNRGPKGGGSGDYLSRRPPFVGVASIKSGIKLLDGSPSDEIIKRRPTPIKYPEPPIPPGGRITFDKDIKFNSSRSSFRDANLTEKTLRDLIKTLKEYPQLRVLILGNFSNPREGLARGDVANVDGRTGTIGGLQLARARAIEQFLVGKGIDWRRILVGNGNINSGGEDGMNSTFVITNPNN